MDYHDYQLVIRIPFKAIDHLQARQIAQGYTAAAALPDGSVLKLQRVHENAPPEGVILNTPVAQSG